MTRNELLAALDSLQQWFAAKPYGFTETCSPGRLQQYRDREREQEWIVRRLEAMDAE